MKPLCYGKLYPKGKTLYFEFRVWEKLSDLRAHVTWAKLDGRTLGLCSPYRKIKVGKYGRMKTSPMLGEINILKRGLNQEVIVHEVAHAAIYWAEERKVNVHDTRSRLKNIMDISCGQELFCYAIGTMCNQLCHILRRNKL